MTNKVRGRLMLSSIHGGTISLSARYSSARAYSSRPPKPRPILFVVIAILLVPLIAFLKGEAALAQIFPAQTNPAQTFPVQTYPAQTYRVQAYRAHTHRAPHRAVLAQQQAPEKKHNEGALMILGGYPGTTYFNLAHDMTAALAGSDDLRLIAVASPGGIE